VEAFLKLAWGSPQTSVAFLISTVMDEVLSGVRSAIAIKILRPPNARRAAQIGEQVRDALSRLEGVVDLQA